MLGIKNLIFRQFSYENEKKKGDQAEKNKRNLICDWLNSWMQKHWIQRADCTMPIHIKDLSIHRFRNLQAVGERSSNQPSADTKGGVYNNRNSMHLGLQHSISIMGTIQGWEWGEGIVRDAHVHTAILKMDNQQGLTLQHRELCSTLCGSLDERGVWERTDACICMAESLCCSPKTITTLLISYTPV